ELLDELLVELALGWGEGDGVLLDAVVAVADDLVEGAPDDGALDQLAQAFEIPDVLDLFLDAEDGGAGGVVGGREVLEAFAVHVRFSPERVVLRLEVAVLALLVDDARVAREEGRG